MKKLFILVLLIANLLSNDIVNNPYLASRIRLFEEWMNTQMDYLSLNGVSVGIVHNQELVYYKGFGYANEEKEIFADENTVYGIASITKLFTSIALMKLVEEGAIKLNDPVTKYIPELYNIQSNGHNVDKITIKSIIRHTTGLPRNSYQMLDTKNREESLSIDEVLLRLTEQNVIYKPNRIYKYSNLAMTIAGEIVARVSGLDYEDYIEENIFIPLEMSGSQIQVTVGKDLNTAPGYGKLIDGKRNKNKWLSKSDHCGSAAAGMKTNITDLSKFIKWHFKVLNEKENFIISHNTLKKMQKVHWIPIPFSIHPIIMSPFVLLSNTFVKIGFGLGYFNLFNFVGHSGKLYGFPSELLMDNDNKIGIIVLSNTDDAPVYYMEDRSISKNLYQIVGKAILKSEDQYNLKWAEYENTYYFDEDFLYKDYVTEINKKLVIIDLEDPFPLKNPTIFKHIGDDSFKESWDFGWNQGETVINFERDNNNNIISYSGVKYRVYSKY